MTKLCIFDLDGTLLNTLESIRFFVNQVLSAHGIANISTEQTKVFVGEGAKMLIAKALRAGNIDTESEEGEAFVEKITNEFVSVYNDNPYYLTEPYPGIPEAVEDLRKRGYKLAVLSNKPDFATQLLVKSFFGDSFDLVLGAGRFPRKPDITSVMFICDTFGVSPEQTAYFGDTSTDMITAKKYGAGKAVGVCWGFRSREELIENGADVVLDEAQYIPSVVD